MVCRNLRQAYLQDGVQGRFQNRFQDWQILPSSSLKLVEFETYYMKPNPPLFFRQQNMQWARNMVHSHFTLCLRFRDYLKRLSQHPWYGLWMRVKGPHHYKVTTLGLCVKWPWEPVTSTLQALSLVEKAELVQVRLTLRLKDQWSMWMQDGGKVYMSHIWHRMDHVSRSLGLSFKNHLLEVGLTQNREIMALQMLTNVDLIYFIMCEDPHE